MPAGSASVMLIASLSFTAWPPHCVLSATAGRYLRVQIYIFIIQMLLLSRRQAASFHQVQLGRWTCPAACSSRPQQHEASKATTKVAA